MKKFRTWYDTKIEEVEVIRETAKYVTDTNGQRWMKRAESFWNYFDTWQEARQFLVDRELTAIATLERQLMQHGNSPASALLAAYTAAKEATCPSSA